MDNLKFIFLDVDGVLNNIFYLKQFGKDCIAEEFVLRLKSVVDQTNAKIVLSSTWRLQKIDRDMVLDALGKHGMIIHDCTPSIMFKLRGHEIAQWLDQNIKEPVDMANCQYAIIDDDKGAGERHIKNLFLTNFDVGLTDEIANNVIEHLNCKYDAIYECVITDADETSVMATGLNITNKKEPELVFEIEKKEFGDFETEAGCVFYLKDFKEGSHLHPLNRFWNQSDIDKAKIEAAKLIKDLNGIYTSETERYKVEPEL